MAGGNILKQFFRTCGIVSLALIFAACTKVNIRPDGTPYDGRGPAPPSAQQSPSTPDPLPGEDLPQGEKEIPPPVTLGARYEAEPEGPDRQTSPVVARLSQQARSQKQTGQLDQALSTTERALRIDPNNPELWLLLGQIQLERQNYIQAEQLARKSISLAEGDTALKARSWRLIRKARHRRGDAAGAEDALENARELEGNLSSIK
jgi:hypothetical protein